MKLLAIAAACALTACAGARKESRPAVVKVSDTDLGRLSPDQMGPVEQARQDLSRARDEVARAQLRLDRAKREESLASADAAAAKAELQRGQAELKIAQNDASQPAIADANRILDAGRLHERAAAAHLDFAKRAIAARQAEVAAAQSRLGALEWQVEVAKLEALQDADIPAATKYDRAALAQRAEEERRRSEATEARVRQLESEAMAARLRWEDLSRQYQARAAQLPSRG